MKKLISSLILALIITSCSSDSDSNNEQLVEKGIVRIEVSTNNTENIFDETLTLQVVGDNIDATNIENVEWTDIQKPHSTTKWFLLQHDLPMTKTYETTNAVSSVTYSSLVFPKEETTTPVTGTLKFYLNGNLKKTETFTLSPSTMTQINVPFVVTK